MNLAAVVILYHPSEAFFCNLKTYINGVSKVFVIDNTPQNIKSPLIIELQNYKNVELIHYGTNLGIAVALNLACEKAIEHQYSHILTMDQDSSFNGNDFQDYKFVAEKLQWDDTSILFPLQAENEFPEQFSDNDFVARQDCMTSGSILNLNLFRKIGGFDENLFIDHVDHDYCYSSIENEFKNILYNKIKLTHSLGEKATFSFLGWSRSYVSHSPLRVYYFIRNGLYVAKKHPIFAKGIFKLIRKELFKSLFLERQKIARIKLIIKARADFKSNRLGEYIE